MFPVLGVLGVRQVGKSTFLMKQWAEIDEANYITFDEMEVVVRAQQAPAQLLLDETDQLKKHVIIDEAHKVPHIFDSIKALVDKNRRMGMFTLSGSVEFSSKSGVKESLAGRMGISKLYPMTLRELSSDAFISPWVSLDFFAQDPSSAKSIETWLERGGMPIFCAISDVDERDALVNNWLEAICYRDLKQLKDAIYDSELAFKLMLYLASTDHEIISLTQLSSIVGASTVSIKKHLSALESLFLIYQIPAFENPRGRAKYIIFDSGVYNALRGKRSALFSRHSCLLILVINEIFAQYEYAGKLKPKLYHYISRSGSEVDLVLETQDELVAIQCVNTVEINPYMQRGMKAFLEKHDQAVGYFVAPVQKGYSLANNLHVIPWGQIG
jgi:predicted AAA+ superfamily ATPase